MYKYKDHRSSIAHQYSSLKRHCNGRVRICDNDRSIYWEGTIKPTPLSRTYLIVIKYTLGSSPICIVKEPNIEALAEGREIPHVYTNTTKIRGTVLCLYLPNIKEKNKTSEWLATDLISETIIPWAALWLSYFEDWLHSDDWQGGGVHPEDLK